MSDEKTSPIPAPDLFAAASLASPFHMRESNERKTTPATSGRKCLDLSGNVGPLGLLEKTLLDSSTWAWTRYSLTWKAKATPQGRLIFQLARLAPRTSDRDSGLLHTPTAKANQMAPSMATRDSGSWGLSLWQTPNVEDAGRTGSKEAWIKYQDQGHTPSCRLRNQVKMWPTPSAQEPGWKNIEVVDKDGNPPTHHNQRFYDKKTGRVVQKGLQQTVADPKSGGKLNPQWVAWLMGYPTEFLSSVPWATQSSPKSQKK